MIEARFVMPVTRSSAMAVGVIALVVLFALLLAAQPSVAGENIVTFDKSFDMKKIRIVGKAQVSLKAEGETGAIRVTVPKGPEAAGIAVPAPEGTWDLSRRAYVMADVKNVGTHIMKVRCRVDNPGVDADAKTDFGIHPSGNFVNGDMTLIPGQSATVQVELRRRKPDWIKVDLFGMVCYPWGQCQSSDPAKSEGTVDAGRISNIFLHVRNNYFDSAFEVSGIRAVGAFTPPPEILRDPVKFFPFVDEFGQYNHAEWPGKAHSQADLAAQRAAEAKDLAAHPSPSNWNQYGGWKAGPQLPATGFFRVTKYNGKWWMVDPEGRLFFSNGMDSVNSHEGNTTLDDRDKWFAKIPPRDSEFKDFFAATRAFPRGYYAGRTPTMFDFTRANLLRKYGPEWKETFAGMVHQRLRSWGFNTIANWGDPAIYQQDKTSYTVNVTFRSKVLEGAEGWWGKSPDSFDPDFKAKIREAMAGQVKTSANDPMCIGYFVGNEMEWGGSDTGLAKMTLISPGEQAGKKVFIADLQAKYGTIDKLNAAWGASHASWDALLQSTTPPDEKKANDDLVAFTFKTCENYFRIVREAVKEVAPNHLYLGCRFAGGFESPAVMSAAAKFCDIVSINMYRRTMVDYRLTIDADVPLLIGEYSFWAIDCGKFNMGGISLEAMEDQAHRADGFKEFLQSVLRHPQFVGAHWFKYMDQATSGRGDGENFQFGFVDVCDRPYPETIDAARLIGEDLYEFRASGR
jgi:hypothetical protein